MSRGAQPVDALEALAAWANEKDVGMAEWKRRASIVDAVAELIEAVGAIRATRGGTMALGAQDARTVRLWAALARVQGSAL